MKMKYFSVLALCTAVSMTSCSKDGKNGLDGTNGTNGTNGVDGKTMLTKTTPIAAGSNCAYGGTKIESGIDANNNGTLEASEVTATQTQYVCNGAGAIYSNWIDVNLVANTVPFPGEEMYSHYQTLASSTITADVVNKGLIMVYYKNKNGYVVAVDRDDVNSISDVDAGGSSFSVRCSYIFKQNYLGFLAYNLYTNTITQMNDNGSAVRYVIIPGNTQGRSVADLQKMSYSEVAKLFSIED
jgi:hypothetical protein